jgi:predicted DNA-binding antitoxin AbrB/MazE fold protein
MSQIITATFADGVLKPHGTLDLKSGTQVRLLIIEKGDVDGDALNELDRLCEEEPIDSGGARMTREQLHERR